MRNSFIIYLLISFCLIYSCSSFKKNNYNEAETLHSDSLKYLLTDNCILFDTTGFRIMSFFKSIHTINGKDFVSYLNLSDSSIEIFDLNAKEIFKKFPLRHMKLERDSFGEITAIYFHTLDSLFILQDLQISLWNGTILTNSWKINTETDSMCLYVYDDNPVTYNPIINSLVILHTCCWCTADSTEFFSTSPIAYYHIDNKNVTTPKIGYSKLYLDDYYGFKRRLSISHKDSLTYISYIIDPNIYIINNNTGVQKIVGGRSNYQKNPAKPIPLKNKDNTEKKLIDIRHDFWYGEIIYDKHRNLYYRFFDLEMPLKNSKGKYNKMTDKERILMVFNDKFELVNEIRFPSKVASIAYVAKDGLYVLKLNEFSKWKGPRYFLVKFQL
jgi:hypothetical protein